mmetsp:Transcript_34487/g.100087  ORF Transcript_34487/g.100087 Transcript_34487/m.100087 type:complete len:231 (-) Transcript_34487:23-715(-)
MDAEASACADGADPKAHGQARPASVVGLRELPEAAGGAAEVGELRLQLDRVTLRAPGSEAPTVADVSMELREGESLLLCGESGVGKSTLLRAIGGLWAAGEGSIARARPRITASSCRRSLICAWALCPRTWSTRSRPRSRRRLTRTARPRSRLPWGRSAWVTSSSAMAWTPRWTSTASCPAARSSAWASRGCFGRRPSSRSWTRRLRPSTRKTRSSFTGCSLSAWQATSP